MHYYTRMLHIILYAILSTTVMGTSLYVADVNIGPNPLIPSQQPLILSGTSNQPISIQTFIYSMAGQRMVSKTTQSNGGDFSTVLATSLELASIHRGLYIVYSTFTYKTETVQKRHYLIIKD